MSIIVYAIWRASAAQDTDWKIFSAGQLVIGIQQSVSFVPYAYYTQFRTEAIAGGADATELAKLYRNGAFFEAFSEILQSGNIERLNAARDDFGAIEDYTDMATGTKSAANQTLLARGQTWLDVIAAETGDAVPETVNAALVTSELNAAGYVWNGSAWEVTP